MGGNFIKLLGCWGRKSSGEDWTKEEGKGNYEIIALKMQELCLNFQKKKFWQGGNPPFNPQKRQKSLRAFFSLGKEIKLKIQGGGKFFKLEERIYTPE